MSSLRDKARRRWARMQRRQRILVKARDRNSAGSVTRSGMCVGTALGTTTSEPLEKGFLYELYAAYGYTAATLLRKSGAIPEGLDAV